MMNSSGLMGERVIGIVGAGNTGKSSSLENLENANKFMYINSDRKPLPYRNNFVVTQVVDNLHGLFARTDENGNLAKGLYDFAEENQHCIGVVIDTLTMLMEKFKRDEIPKYSNSQQGWGDYGNYVMRLMETIKSSRKWQIILMHTDTTVNQGTGLLESKILVDGKVGSRGLESDFTNIVSCKQMPIDMLEQFKNPFLNITEEERETGVKNVFQTRPNRLSVGDKCRSSRGMWTVQETYIDNNIQIVMNKIKQFYKLAY